MENDVVRLDKYLADCGIGTRSVVSGFVKKGRVAVDGTVVKDPSMHIDEAKSEITFDGRMLGFESVSYFMLNKPAGVVTATKDRISDTVLGLIKEEKRRDLFPVGRLDKDTEGLLLITNDGELAHRLLAPGKHVDKTYFARLDLPANEADKEAFAEGLVVDRELTALPAKLEFLGSSKDEVLVTVCEGKFHQIKRMFEAVGKQVMYLKRLSMGPLRLDENLKPGEYRRLTEEEIKRLKEL